MQDPTDFMATIRTIAGSRGVYRPEAYVFVLEVLEESPGASGRRLRALVGGTAQSVDDAVALAVEDGTIRRERGPKNGWAYHLVGLEGADHEG